MPVERGKGTHKGDHSSDMGKSRGTLASKFMYLSANVAACVDSIQQIAGWGACDPNTLPSAALSTLSAPVPTCLPPPGSNLTRP